MEDDETGEETADGQGEEDDGVEAFVFEQRFGQDSVGGHQDSCQTCKPSSCLSVKQSHGFMTKTRTQIKFINLISAHSTNWNTDKVHKFNKHTQ